MYCSIDEAWCQPNKQIIVDTKPINCDDFLKHIIHCNSCRLLIEKEFKQPNFDINKKEILMYALMFIIIILFIKLLL